MSERSRFAIGYNNVILFVSKHYIAKIRMALFLKTAYQFLQLHPTIMEGGKEFCLTAKNNCRKYLFANF